MVDLLSLIPSWDAPTEEWYVIKKNLILEPGFEPGAFGKTASIIPLILYPKSCFYS